MRRVAAIVMLCFFASTLHGQSPNATVTGRVTDPSRGIIANANVILTNQGTNIRYTSMTNQAGSYNVPELPPGTYKVEVEAVGFKSLIRPGIVLHVQDILELNFELELGSVQETVTVEGTAPQVDLVSSTISGLVNDSEVVELPLNGRDWTSLATLQPGVNTVLTQSPNGVAASREARGYGTQMTISGTRPQMNNYRLDGISIVDYAGGSPGSTNGVALGVDAIAEFSVLTANYSAEYGRTSGGVVNAITHSGSNSFHGDAYEFLRNDRLDAKNFFDQAGAIPPFRRNQFGASAGGPIQKGKTFFFVDYEGLRQALGTTNIDKVPSQNARDGILNFASPGAFPAGCVATTVANQCQLTVSPLVAPFLPIWPLPNAGLIAPGNSGNFDVATNNVSTENFGTVRIDRKFSDRDSIFGSWRYDSSSDNQPDNLDTIVRGNVGTSQMIAVQETHDFSSSFLNTLRGGINRIHDVSEVPIQTINPIDADGSLGAFPGRDAPQITVTGLASYSGGVGGLSNETVGWTAFQGYDDAIMTRGTHTLKFGFAFEHDRFNNLTPSRPNGIFTFGSLAAFLTDQPTTFSGSPPGRFTEFGQRQNIIGGYFEDDWRVRSNLTIELGLRYEMATVPTEVHNQLVNLPTFTSPPPGHLGSPYFNNPTLRNFEPRVGFSWDPFHDGKTAVRGAFGIFDVLPLEYDFSLMQSHSAPFVEQISGSHLPAGSFPTGAASLSNVTPSELTSNSIEEDPHRNYVMIWNLNVQRQLTPSTSMTVGYVGNHGVHMINREDDVNSVIPAITPYGYLFPFPAGSGTKLNPAVGDISGLYWTGDAEYDALQVQVTKRMSHHFQVQGSYTWGKAIDTGSATIVGDPFVNSISSRFFFCKSCRRGVSDFNIGQTLVINYIWDLPSPTKGGAIGSHVLGGWELGGIFTAETGLPMTPLIGGDPLGLNSTDPFAYPSRLTGPGCTSLVNPGNPNNYIKLSCFTLPQAPASLAAQCTPFPGFPGTCSNLLGNSGRNIITGPGLETFDFSVYKNNYIKRISESFNVQFRAELFNVLNHPNFATPVDNEDLFAASGQPVGGAGSVDVTSTTSRQIQFAIKVIW